MGHDREPHIGDRLEPRARVRELQASLVEAESNGVDRTLVRRFLKKSPEARAEYIKGLAGEGTIKGIFLERIAQNILAIEREGVDEKEIDTRDLLQDLMG